MNTKLTPCTCNEVKTENPLRDTETDWLPDRYMIKSVEGAVMFSWPRIDRATQYYLSRMNSLLKKKTQRKGMYINTEQSTDTVIAYSLPQNFDAHLDRSTLRNKPCSNKRFKRVWAQVGFANSARCRCFLVVKCTCMFCFVPKWRPQTLHVYGLTSWCTSKMCRLRCSRLLKEWPQ